MRLESFKRVPLAHLPTPIEPLERLNRDLGVAGKGPKLFIKRDDCTGLALGGNKTRKLEYALAEALAQGADRIITAGGIQSNHVRQTAAAAAKLNLACDLVLNRNVPERDQAGARILGRGDAYEETGNILLDRLLGAKVHIHPAGIDRVAAMATLAEALQVQGHRPYIIPGGASYPTGALGFVNCALEIEQQATALGLTIDAVVHASGSGGTQAGLVAGFLAADSTTRVIGIDIDAEPAEVQAKVLDIAGETLVLLDCPREDLASHIDLRAGYAGAAYGVPNEATAAAISQLARSEGILLDPVYTGKAFAGLLDLVQRGEFAAGETVLFLHTGGAPALFAYPGLFDEV